MIDSTPPPPSPGALPDPPSAHFTCDKSTFRPWRAPIEETPIPTSMNLWVFQIHIVHPIMIITKFSKKKFFFFKDQTVQGRSQNFPQDGFHFYPWDWLHFYPRDSFHVYPYLILFVWQILVLPLKLVLPDSSPQYLWCQHQSIHSSHPLLLLSK